MSCSFSAVFLSSLKSLSLEAIRDSISCSLPEDVCFTDSGNDYYSSCVFPFIDNGKQFKACTDVNSKNENREEKTFQQYQRVKVPFIGHGVLQKLMLQTISSLGSGDIALVHVDTVVAPLLVSEPADHVDMTVF